MAHSSCTLTSPVDWTLVCHQGDGNEGTLSVVHQRSGEVTVDTPPIDTASGLDLHHKPWFLGLAADGAVLLMEPASKTIRSAEAFPADAFAAYAYREGDHIWFMNDGDKAQGIDPIDCPQGSSVLPVRNTGHSAPAAELLAKICVGRGHHVTAFTPPSPSAPQVPYRAFVSNLLEGTISVVGNDPNDPGTYLQVIHTIDLSQPHKEDSGIRGVPNSAFPHGMEYSPATGKVYNLNNGYGNIVVIDPLTNSVASTIDVDVASNLLLAPGGRFLIAKGADRQSNPEHVVGRLSVINAQTGEIETTLELPDIYPSTYRYNPQGSKLYVTTAATGKGDQRTNLQLGKVLVYDSTRLPELTLLQEITVGTADCGRRPIAFLRHGDSAPHVFVPNPTDGTLSILDGDSDQVAATLRIGQPGASEFSFSFWGEKIYGA